MSNRNIINAITTSKPLLLIYIW